MKAAVIIIICRVHQAMEVDTEGRLLGRAIILEKMLSLGGQITITGQVTVKVICNPVLGGPPLLEAPILLIEVATALGDSMRDKFMVITGLGGQGLPLSLKGEQGHPGLEVNRRGHGPLLITLILGLEHLKDLGHQRDLGRPKGQKGSIDQARPKGKGLRTG